MARSCLVDRKETLTRFATGSAAAVPVYSDADAAEAAGKQASGSGRSGLIWTQFTELSTFYFQRWVPGTGKGGTIIHG